MTQLYLAHFWVETNVWVEQEALGTGKMFFLDFLNLLSMGFPTVCDTTILNEHPFLVISGPRTHFMVGQEEGGAEQFFVQLFEIYFPWAFQWYMTKLYFLNTHFCSFLCPGPTLGQCGMWVGEVKMFLVLEHSPSGR